MVSGAQFKGDKMQLDNLSEIILQVFAILMRIDGEGVIQTFGLVLLRV